MEWAKVYDEILYNKWYLLDFQDTNNASAKTWTLPNFQENGTVMTFSGPFVQSYCESCKMLKITKVKFMEAEGASNLPTVI